MKKKMFIISDIHGHYTEMVRDLKEAGFDENDDNHLLIVCGDIFDRGDENVEVYNFLKKLTDNNKAIVINGNHHKFFIEWLEGKDMLPFNYYYNGMRDTLGDFLQRTAPFESWCFLEENANEPTYNDYVNWCEFARKEVMKEYPELLEWLKNMPRYYETKNYIFTHGAIDLNCEDWHKPHCCRGNLTDWDALDFDDGTFITKINNTGKKIVVGHFGTSHLRKMWNINDNKNEHDILMTDDDKIFIDSTIALTKKLNVLVIEDETI